MRLLHFGLEGTGVGREAESVLQVSMNFCIHGKDEFMPLFTAQANHALSVSRLVCAT